MVIPVARRKQRIKRELEREWGSPAYVLWQASDFHEPYPEQYCKELKAKKCKCVVLPSVRPEYAERGYLNVWTSCRDYAKLLRKRR